MKKRSLPVPSVVPLSVLLSMLSFYFIFVLYGCNCDSVPLHLSEDQKNWTNKSAASKFIFQSALGESDTLTQTLSDAVIECGGDECSTQCDIQYFYFYKSGTPFFMMSLGIYFMEFNLDSLAKINLNDADHLGSYSYGSENIYGYQNWEITLKDSLGNKLLTFSNNSISEPNQPFIKLKFLKAKGIISYTDRDKIQWTLKP
jgi:hypothetical protein